MAKFTDWFISAVRYDDDHSCIVKVRAHPNNDDKVGTLTEQLRSTVVLKLRTGETYSTILKKPDGGWRIGEDVRVVKIGDEYFIRTDANNTKKDNLGELPGF
jgi:hypothetical protein